VAPMSLTPMKPLLDPIRMPTSSMSIFVGRCIMCRCSDAYKYIYIILNLFLKNDYNSYSIQYLS